jgi:4-hydroxy-tetrahydrodipicolinate reductase
MGALCAAAIRDEADLELCGTSGRRDDLGAKLRACRPQVLVEFTVPDAVEANVRAALEAGVHVVSGTTGLPRERARALGELAQARGLGFLLAPNFAIGVLLLQRFAREAVRWLPDVEIVELHHADKTDAPSGTALATADQIAAAATGDLNAGRPRAHELAAGARGGVRGGVPIHSVRLPGLVAHQEVIFGGLGQALTLRHDALDRRAFVPGVLLAIRRIDRYRGLVDSLEPMLADGDRA